MIWGFKAIGARLQIPGARFQFNQKPRASVQDFWDLLNNELFFNGITSEPSSCPMYHNTVPVQGGLATAWL
jgi:hypothetical protein